jgi:hypothetical protein
LVGRLFRQPPGGRLSAFPGIGGRRAAVRPQDTNQLTNRTIAVAPSATRHIKHAAHFFCPDFASIEVTLKQEASGQ